MKHVKAQDVRCGKTLSPCGFAREGKSTELSKPRPSKVIQLKPRRSFLNAAAKAVGSMDHDYCLLSKVTGEIGKHWNVKLSNITIRAIKPSTVTVQVPPADPVVPESPFPESALLESSTSTLTAPESPLLPVSSPLFLCFQL